MSKVRSVVGVLKIEGRDEIDPFLGVLGIGRNALGGGVRRSKPMCCYSRQGQRNKSTQSKRHSRKEGLRFFQLCLKALFIVHELVNLIGDLEFLPSILSLMLFFLRFVNIDHSVE
jgi:hypothetical protein